MIDNRKIGEGGQTAQHLKKKKKHSYKKGGGQKT